MQKKKNKKPLLQNKLLLLFLLLLLAILLVDPVVRIKTQKGVFIRCPKRVLPNNKGEQCCIGYKSILEESTCNYNKEMDLISAPETSYIRGGRNHCTKCGNGKCEENEGICNCPEDCK